MKATKTRTLFYKRAQFQKEGPQLKELLGKALAVRNTVGLRRERLGPEGEGPIWRVLGEFKPEEEFFFGVLMLYVPGQVPAYVVDDEQASTLTVEKMAAPVTDEGKRRELVEGMLFFAVFDNHLVMMQSTSLRSDHLETHLQWLLHRAAVLEGSNTLQLVDQLPKKIREKLAATPVKGLQIGGDLLPASQETPNQPAGDTFVASEMPPAVNSISLTETTSSTGVWDVVKGLLDKDKAAQLDVDALAGSNIEYTLKITYKRSTTKDGQKLLNTLGSALRHAEGVDTTIRLKNGGKLQGSDLKLSGPVKIETVDGMPSSEAVYEVMRKWLLDKLKSGDVKA